MKFPSIALCGPGGSGKDFIAAWLRDNTILRYSHSTSFCAAQYVWQFLGELTGHQVYQTKAECFADRVNHRELWAKCIDEYNRIVPHKLYAECLEFQDVLTGIRKLRELKAVRDNCQPMLFIWVHNRYHADDPTQEYGPDECDIILENHVTFVDGVACVPDTEHTIHDKLTSLAYSLQIHKGQLNQRMGYLQ